MCYFLYRSEDNALSDIVMGMRRKYEMYLEIMIISNCFPRVAQLVEHNQSIVKVQVTIPRISKFFHT